MFTFAGDLISTVDVCWGGLIVGVCFEVEWMGIVVQSWVIRGSLGAGFGALANVAVLQHNGMG